MIGLHDTVQGGPAPSHNPRELADAVFGPGGLAASRFHLEHRPQQAAMAAAAAEAIASGDPLLCEAGTGVGKSLAYLIPGILHATTAKKPLVVSTKTIVLQQQILEKDLPICRRLFAADPRFKDAADFRAALLLGRGNYLCPHRLAQARRHQLELLGQGRDNELEKLRRWAENTKTGLLQELPERPEAEVWELVNADSSACSPRTCSPATCFYRKARAEIEQAHVIVVNHSLLFALVGAGAGPGGPGVLFPGDTVVLDEAHTVPAVASDHFGAKVTSYGLNRLLLGLFHPKRNTGLLKGIATEHTLQLVIDCLDAGELFFETLRSLHLAKQPIVRLREPFWTDPTLDDPLRQLAEAVGTTADRIDDEGRREQLADQRLRLRAVRDTLRRSLRLEPETDVHWLERQRGPRRVVEVRSAPIDVAPCLREHLFEAGSSIVLTSATLSIGGAMDHFAAQVGASDARTCIQDSPFPFRRHMRIYIAKDVPPPERGNPAPCQEAIADYLEFCLPRVEGGSLVLFTSFADLETAARRLAPFLERAGRPFSRQAPRTTTRELAAWLRDQRDGILFGTESFWTGIDIPGPALSQVVITRLPFEVPTHPLAEARADHCLARGGDPFRDLQLPDAVMRFRQGIGRLIRSREDRGLITILDSRILRKTYGRAFLAGLPHRNYTAIDRHSRDSHFQPFANPTPPPRPPPS